MNLSSVSQSRNQRLGLAIAITLISFVMTACSTEKRELRTNQSQEAQDTLQASDNSDREAPVARNSQPPAARQPNPSVGPTAPAPTGSSSTGRTPTPNASAPKEEAPFAQPVRTSTVVTQMFPPSQVPLLEEMQNEPTNGLTSIALVNADIEKMKAAPADKLAEFDRQNSGLFTKMFAGTTPRTLLQFLTSRLNHIWSEDEFHQYLIEPAQFEFMGWKRTNPTQSISNDTQVATLAFNISTGLWIQGLIEGKPVSLFKDDRFIPVSSPRIGIIVIGPGYKESFTQANGTEIKKPSAIRQAVLLHEARHSDCTGGITPDEVAILKRAESIEQAERELKRKTCGHMHITCPKGHELAGLPACDEHSWGAYTVSAIYTEAFASFAESETDRVMLEASAIDAWSRVLVGKSKYISGEFGSADLSTSGLQRKR